MRKTKLMATIGQYNPMTGNYAHTDRRVYVDDNEYLHVKINGEFVRITWLFTHGRTVSLW